LKVNINEYVVNYKLPADCTTQARNKVGEAFTPTAKCCHKDKQVYARYLPRKTKTWLYAFTQTIRDLIAMSTSLTSSTSTQHPITAQILEQVKAIDVQLPESVDDKWAEIEQKEIALAVHIAELGYRYMDLREAVGHGEFLKALEQRGVAKSTVNRYINVAKFFLEAPDTNVPALGHLKPTQISILAKLPDEEKQALTPEKIEEYAPMSTRALEAEVKQLRLNIDEQDSVQAENDQLKAQIETLKRDEAHQINVYEYEKLKKAPETKYGLHVEVAVSREKAIVIAELLTIASVELNHLVQRCTNSALAQELSRDIALAVHTSTSGQIMQLANSLKAVQDNYGLSELTKPDNLPVYSEQEMHEAMSNANYAKDGFTEKMAAIYAKANAKNNYKIEGSNA
jgi:Protein of unknown function (DUF3102)